MLKDIDVAEIRKLVAGAQAVDYIIPCQFRESLLSLGSLFSSVDIGSVLERKEKLHSLTSSS